MLSAFVDTNGYQCIQPHLNAFWEGRLGQLPIQTQRISSAGRSGELLHFAQLAAIKFTVKILRFGASAFRIWLGQLLDASLQLRVLPQPLVKGVSWKVCSQDKRIGYALPLKMAVPPAST